MEEAKRERAQAGASGGASGPWRPDLTRVRKILTPGRGHLTLGCRPRVTVLHRTPAPRVGVPLAAQAPPYPVGAKLGVTDRAGCGLASSSSPRVRREGDLHPHVSYLPKWPPGPGQRLGRQRHQVNHRGRPISTASAGVRRCPSDSDEFPVGDDESGSVVGCRLADVLGGAVNLVACLVAGRIAGLLAVRWEGLGWWGPVR
jgi:hypothetical protein